MPLAMQWMAGVKALAIRLDGCVMAAPVGAVAGGETDACLLVRPDQYDFYFDYALRMADRGVKRVVFLDSQLHLAQQWIDRRSSAPLCHLAL